MLTDNPVMLRRHESLPPLICAQKTATKIVPNEDDFISSNINSFGNSIGQITNRITSMYEVRSKFDEDSEEYKELTYRIMSGEKFQQDEIDKAKGIISNPMPRYWYDYFALANVDENKKQLYTNIVAEKKPYFMKYIYPQLRKDFKKHQKRASRNCLVQFNANIEDLLRIEEQYLTAAQKEFVRFYYITLPVGNNDCVMNKICHRFEEEFDRYISKLNDGIPFDYSVLKTGVVYNPHTYYNIVKLYDEYNERLRKIAVHAANEKTKGDEVTERIWLVNNEFREKCADVCPSEEMLCDIIIDMTYKRSQTKKFAWSMCSRVIINNLLKKNNYQISYPVLDDDGDLEYGGEKFSIHTKEVVVSNE